MSCSDGDNGLNETHRNSFMNSETAIARIKYIISYRMKAAYGWRSLFKFKVNNEGDGQ